MSPIVDKVLEVMKSKGTLLRFNWTEVAEGGLSRIRLRQSIYEMLTTKSIIDSLSHEYEQVGRMTLMVLH